MYNNPFCVYNNNIIYCTSSTGALNLQFSSFQCIESSWIQLAASSIFMCGGVACSPVSHEFLFLGIDSSIMNILRYTSKGECTEEIDIGPLFAKSTAYAYGKFWVILLEGDFDSKLAYFDQETRQLCFPLINDGYYPPKLNLTGFPLIFSCGNELVLFNSFVNILYWLNEDCSVKNYKELPETTIIGPAYDGSLLALNVKEERLLKINSPNHIEILDNKFQSPCDDIMSIALTNDNHIIIERDPSGIFLSSSNFDKWKDITSQILGDANKHGKSQ